MNTTVTNNKWLIGVIFVLLLINLATLGLFWLRKPAPNGGEPGRNNVFEFVSKELQLNSAQTDTYNKLRKEHHEKQVIVLDSLKIAKNEFYALLQRPAISDSVFNTRLDKIGKFQQELDLVNYQHFQQIRAFCTPEQQVKFDKIILEVLQRFSNAQSGRPGFRPHPGKDSPPPHINPDREDFPPPPPPGEDDQENHKGPSGPEHPSSK